MIHPVQEEVEFVVNWVEVGNFLESDMKSVKRKKATAIKTDSVLAYPRGCERI